MKTDLITPNYNLEQNSYVSFDAMSLRNLIVQRLDKQGIFTDQNYIGSNLASIIDIISFAFNTLIFYLNRTSSESLFSEAQLYENINRIVKLLNYKPTGFQTSALVFQAFLNNKSGQFPTETVFYTIPRYSSILIGSIPFSFVEDVSFSIDNQPDDERFELTDLSNNKMLYQGVFKESPIYTAVGDKNELFVLKTQPNTFIDHFNINVYVFETEERRWYQYKETVNSYLEDSTSRIFEKRLNQNLQYEFIFGNDINGRKLKKDEKIVIFYLQSLGREGIVGPNNSTSLSRNVLFNSISYSSILADVRQEQSSLYLNSSLFGMLEFTNVAGSTDIKDIESPEEIKKNAPLAFSSQYRLVTHSDYENWIKSNFTAFVSDVRVFNNWEYTSKYLKHFNKLSLDPLAFRQVALNQVLYADACNFNNVYICCVPRIGLGSTLKYLYPSQKETIIQQLNNIKTITSEITFLDPYYKGLFFGTRDDRGNFVFEDRELCKLEIIKDSKTNRNSNNIIFDVSNIFQEFFDAVSQKLGKELDYNQLISSIMSVEGVADINTIRTDSDVKFRGLSFCLWNSIYPTIDNELVFRNIKLEPFEFLYFENLFNISQYITITEPS